MYQNVQCREIFFAGVSSEDFNKVNFTEGISLGGFCPWDISYINCGIDGQ
jgi:hypothetical protein